MTLYSIGIHPLFSPSHTKLKTRDHGQTHPDDLRERDLKRELLDRERAAARDRRQEKMVSADRRPAIDHSSGQPQSKKSRSSNDAAAASTNLDADDPVEDSGSESDDSSDDDDEGALLMAELQKIKAEKAQEEAEREDEKRAEEEQIRMENILTGNPLLKDKYSAADKAAGGDLKVRRRWDDDVVFKNCSR